MRSIVVTFCLRGPGKLRRSAREMHVEHRWYLWTHVQRMCACGCGVRSVLGPKLPLRASTVSHDDYEMWLKSTLFPSLTDGHVRTLRTKACSSFLAFVNYPEGIH